MVKILLVVAVTIKCDKCELNLKQRVVGECINSNCSVCSPNFLMMEQHAIYIAFDRNTKRYQNNHSVIIHLQIQSN